MVVGRLPGEGVVFHPCAASRRLHGGPLSGDDRELHALQNGWRQRRTAVERLQDRSDNHNSDPDRQQHHQQSRRRSAAAHHNDVLFQVEAESEDDRSGSVSQLGEASEALAAVLVRLRRLVIRFLVHPRTGILHYLVQLSVGQGDVDGLAYRLSTVLLRVGDHHSTGQSRCIIFNLVDSLVDACFPGS